MQKWEYEFVKIKHPRLPNTPTDLADFRLCLMDLGEEGWELVSVDNGMAYFKRPVIDKPPIYRESISNGMASEGL